MNHISGNSLAYRRFRLEVTNATQSRRVTVRRNRSGRISTAFLALGVVAFLAVYVRAWVG